MMKSHVLMLAAAAVLLVGALAFGWSSAVVYPLLAVGCMAMMMFMMWSMSGPRGGSGGSNDDHNDASSKHHSTRA